MDYLEIIIRSEMLRSLPVMVALETLCELADLGYLQMNKKECCDDDCNQAQP